MLCKIIIAKKDADFFEKCCKQFDTPGLIFGKVEVDERNIQFILCSDWADTFFWVGIWYATKDKNRNFLIKNIIESNR